MRAPQGATMAAPRLVRGEVDGSDAWSGASVVVAAAAADATSLVVLSFAFFFVFLGKRDVCDHGHLGSVRDTPD